MTTSARMRQWQGPALFSYGFRPFFLFGAAWAALAMAMWIATLAGMLNLPTRLDPVAWHVHAFLFGYLGAVIAGFLLTAVPNWTGRLPVTGWRLAGLFALWMCGRAAMAVSASLPLGVAAAIDLAFPVVLSATILREIIAGKNWRNLMVLALLVGFTLANLIFHIDAGRGTVAALGAGTRMAIATVIMMISLVGGRIIPSFTRNWMVKTGRSTLPTPPMQRFDTLTLLVTLAVLAAWVMRSANAGVAIGLGVVAVMHIIRLCRWRGLNTLSDPLLWVLHLGYLFVPLGALVSSLALLWPDVLPTGAAQHVWMAGAFGLMTLGVMARATLGHTGQALVADGRAVAMFLCLVGAVCARVVAGLWPDIAGAVYAVSGVLSIAAFAGFCVIYGGALVSPRKQQR